MNYGSIPQIKTSKDEAEETGNTQLSKKVETGSLNSLGVPIQSFPMIGSAQVVSGSDGKTKKTNRKVQLKPGHSLMDWIRFGHKNKDLAGTGGKLLKVNTQELATHNKLDDCWMAVRGLVYNITPYMEFHPGGDDELMRRAGADGTDLFDEIHRWVNVESMLEKCLVGKLIPDEIKSPSPSLSLKKKALTNGLKSPAPPLFKTPEQQKPRYDWFEVDASVTIAVYTKWNLLKHEHIIIDKTDRDIRILVLVGQFSYFIHRKLTDEVEDDYEVNVGISSGKAEVKLKKKTQKLWGDLGKIQEDDEKFIKTTQTAAVYRKCQLVSVQKVTHDTNLYCFKWPKGTRLCVPVGHHCIAKALVQGMEISRSYTIIPPSMLPGKQDDLVSKGKQLYIMIKIYKDGVLTPLIEKLKIGETIELSNHEGDFEESRLSSCTDLIMLAAGTGFTPMAGLIQHCAFLKPKENRLIKLMFFNKESKDILWKEELDEVKKKYSNFELVHVLSRADQTWKGLTGRIRTDLLKGFIPKKDGNNIIICACGPNEFTQEAIRLAKDLGYKDDMLHAFLA